MPRRMVRTAVALLTVPFLWVGAGIAPAQAADDPVTVMSRNIYLGADVSVALKLLPDMPAAAQFMWEQVAITDFSSRAPSLAGELARERPDVVALQEATVWMCRSSVVGSSTVVFDFTAELMEAAAAAGAPYVIASHDGAEAFNPGYSFPVLPFLTTVHDPATFQPLFGSDTAACGFTIGDALLVRADLADRVTAVGTGDYESAYAVVPVVFEVARGYAWADLTTPQGSTVRVVTTHLEYAWDPGTPPVSAAQARELVSVLSEWSMPLVVTGDFNADPRDPRGSGDPNPGIQPDTSTGCSEQVADPSASTATPECNAYWIMVQAGFVDAGPDALDPGNRTWGASALLAGPDLERLAEAEGNLYGYTDRLDYLFTTGGVQVESVRLVGAEWPDGIDSWACDDPAQVENATAAAEALGVTLDAPACLPTDHVGLVATLDVSGAAATSAQGGSGDDSPGVLPAVVALVAVVGLAGAGVLLWRHNH